MCSTLCHSVAMFRPSKLIRIGYRSLFSSIISIYLTILFISDELSAQNIPSKSETQEALRTVSKYLANETGATWLADLAKNRETVPLTTNELMEAVLASTTENSTVWQAAATIKSALAVQIRQETIPELTKLTPSPELEPDDWSDVITDMEKHDDIICLYRKDAESKMEKSSDWQKLLSNVSPGYTVHLALDNGHKYVICLKKINVPTTTLQTTVTETTSIEDTTMTTPMMTQRTEESTVETSTEPFTTKKETTTEEIPVTEESLIESSTKEIENRREDPPLRSFKQSFKKIMELDDHKCPKKLHRTKAIAIPQLMIKITRNVASGMQSPVYNSWSWLPSFDNLMRRVPYVEKNLWPELKSPLKNLCECSNTERNLKLNGNDMNLKYPLGIPSMRFIPSLKSNAFINNPRTFQFPRTPWKKVCSDQTNPSFLFNRKLPASVFPKQATFQTPMILPIDRKLWVPISLLKANRVPIASTISAQLRSDRYSPNLSNGERFDNIKKPFISDLMNPSFYNQAVPSYLKPFIPEAIPSFPPYFNPLSYAPGYSEYENLNSRCTENLNSGIVSFLNYGNPSQSRSNVLQNLPHAVPRGFFNTWRILGGKDSSSIALNSQNPCVPCCPNACQETISIEIKMQDPRGDPTGVNVLPKLKSRGSIALTDPRNGLFSIENGESSSPNEILNSRKDPNHLKESSQESEEDEVKSLETWIGKIESNVESRRNRTDGIGNKSLSKSIKKTEENSDKDFEEMESVKAEDETTKSAKISEVINTTELMRFANESTTEMNNNKNNNNTSKNS